MKVNKVGIDAGGSLIKIAYQERDRMHYKKYPIDDLDKVVSWLTLSAPSKVALTGGKAGFLQKQYLPHGSVVPEFKATCEGALYFLSKEGNKNEESFLLVNIGTGTSWHVINGEKYERILGSGVGGGTFTGLGSLLTSTTEYRDLAELAVLGNKGNVDLLVKDIYESAETPINGDLTAANFAKGNRVEHTEADRMASVANMIAETITLLTKQAAGLHSLKKVVITGSALTGNSSLRKGLEFYLTLVGMSFEVLPNGEYCGAMGAYLNV